MVQEPEMDSEVFQSRFRILLPEPEYDIDIAFPVHPELEFLKVIPVPALLDNKDELELWQDFI